MKSGYRAVGLGRLTYQFWLVALLSLVHCFPEKQNTNIEHFWCTSAADCLDGKTCLENHCTLVDAGNMETGDSDSEPIEDIQEDSVISDTSCEAICEPSEIACLSLEECQLDPEACPIWVPIKQCDPVNPTPICDGTHILCASQLFSLHAEYAENQTNPDILQLSSQTYLVVWEVAPPNGDSSDIQAQFLTAAGEPFGLPFEVNLTTSGHHSTPNLLLLSDTTFVITWNSKLSDSLGISGQRFSAAGDRLASEFSVNAALLSPNAAVLKDQISFAEQYLVVWGQNSDLLGQIFVNDGTRRGEVIDLKDLATAGLHDFQLLKTSDCEAFLLYLPDNLAPSIWGQLLTSEGIRIGPPQILMNSTDSAEIKRFEAAVISDSQGLLIFETQPLDPNISHITGALFHLNGTLLQAAFQIDSAQPERNFNPKVLKTYQDGTVIFWESNNSPVLRARYINSDGALNQTEFPIFETGLLLQYRMAVAPLDQGFIVMATGLNDLLYTEIVGKTFYTRP